MTRQELVEKARTLLAHRLKIDRKMIRPETSIYDLGADSLDVLVIARDFEEVFSIVIYTREIQQIRTFDDIISQLSQKIGCEG